MGRTNTPTPEGPYRVEITPTGIGRSDLIRLVGPNGITVANESKGDYSGVTFNFWCKRLNEAHRAALPRDVLERARDLVRWTITDMCFKAPEQYAGSLDSWTDKLNESMVALDKLIGGA